MKKGTFWKKSKLKLLKREYIGKKIAENRKKGTFKKKSILKSLKRELLGKKSY